MLLCCLLWYLRRVYTLRHGNKIPSLRKNQHKAITITICKTGYNSYFCRYAGNKTNSAANELNTINLNKKAAAPIGKIGLPLNSFFFLYL